ncbi:protein CBFA2T1-like isoform X2 [Mercenaria mercenaria]|uniref:protein CBFA2T1-like isoform X2 n=1 Tax=Mercenaria mercenaria TaxID=6596 RepID=UPI001E1D6CB9|nr:protein CBFA2T1-like isoform X2 [Mercenaria mercenaria]
MDSDLEISDMENQCDSIMPESPETKGQGHTPITSPTPMAGGVAPGLRESTRPHSNNNAGEHSPVPAGMMNGRMPTPPTVQMSSSQQLPPACGARQLSKLKRFLTTLQQFGSDISAEIGERVRALVLGLVNSHLSIEEFHSKLQEATNFPLRPFVIPFLKANLPLLQRELVHLARMAKETPQNYLAQNEHILFNATQSPLESQDTPVPQINENGKRLSPETRGHENGLDVHPAKRHQPTSPHGPNRISPNGILNLSNGPIRLEDISISRELREREKLERERLEKERTDHRDRDFDRERHFPSYNFGRSESAFDPLERFDDDWRHVETMLNCIIGMVDKTRRALSVLQDRSLRDREELSIWMRRGGGDDSDLKKRNPETWLNMRNTDERISDVRRRAEEAVQEVKRQAMLELHKAVAAADTKANEMVSQERAKMERAVQDIRKQTREEVLNNINHQEESSESCWNCGRKASETCSGCNTARYCGSFCQHKDWENHHHVCGKASLSALSQARDTPPQTVSLSPQVPSSPHPHNSPSPVNSVSSVKSVSRSSTPADVKQTEARAAEVSR